MRVFLVGLPGAGTSTVGALLGHRLGWPFLDDDALLARMGSVSKALTLLLGMPGDLVAAPPGEAVDDPSERARLAGAGAHVVWLRCSLPVLTQRAGTRLGDDPATVLRRLNADRIDLYEHLATQVVDTDANPAGAAAKLVIDALQR